LTSTPFKEFNFKNKQKKIKVKNPENRKKTKMNLPTIGKQVRQNPQRISLAMNLSEAGAAKSDHNGVTEIRFYGIRCKFGYHLYT